MEKVGVYVCHCGSNIANTVDVSEVVNFAKTLPSVKVATDYNYMCSDPGQDLIRKDIAEKGLTRVVVAACSPSMHEKTFQSACETAGLNPYLFQMANIREHCSWTVNSKADGTPKAKRIVAAAVNRVQHHEPLHVKMVHVTPAVLVVGGGIAGIEAALKVANAGKKVYLVERNPSIGGHMAQFDKTFPTLDCAACILTPKMVDVARHPNIELLAYSEIQQVSGYVGNFKVKVVKKPRYVDPDRCVGCGVCASKCPFSVPSEFDLGLGKRKAIYVPFPQAVPLIYTIDTERCAWFTKGACRVCEKFCEAKAIDFDQQPETVELDVGAIIVATGFEVFNAARAPQFGYSVYPGVYTSLEFERLLNASGPTGGKIVLRNGKEPSSVAILHCVGSRDRNYNAYCSRVCCMYSVKVAHVIRERLPRARIYELYIDLRAFGKGYEEFYNRVQMEDIIFIRGKGAEVTDYATTPEEKGKLIVTCEDTLLGKARRIPVDMVILSVGIEAQRDAQQVARMFGLGCGREGFFLEKHPKLAPVSSASDGVFIAGCCQSPKEIPDTVAQAAAAAAEALDLVDTGAASTEPTVAVIDEALCSSCKTCISLCPYSAISFDESKNVSVVQEALCKGCGVCVAACPSNAIKQYGFTNKQIEAEIEMAVA